VITECYVELYIHDATGLWGWECLTCHTSWCDFATAAEAERDAEAHEQRVRDFAAEVTS
jgi:hypothetical protein